jgi:tetratricopeptide (TPR) repeat protein
LTLGVIETRAGTPERARFHCEQALKIFREMEDTRGIGSACTAFAESLRRMTNSDLLTYKQAVEYLKTACIYADEAVSVFREQVKEPLRLTEAYIEVGCVYREWTRQLLSDDPERMEKVVRGLGAYEFAVEIADQWGYEYRAIDALVNMAWLYYYAGDYEAAEKILRERVKIRIADEQFFTPEHVADQENAPISWNWVQLGKANILLGLLHFDQYKKAIRMKNKSEAQHKLRQAAHNWTLSMAYNSLYGKDFRDFTKGREVIYEHLEQLNMEELGWVVDSMKMTHLEYHIAENHRSLEHLLKERLGLDL